MFRFGIVTFLYVCISFEPIIVSVTIVDDLIDIQLTTFVSNHLLNKILKKVVFMCVLSVVFFCFFLEIGDHKIKPSVWSTCGSWMFSFYVSFISLSLAKLTKCIRYRQMTTNMRIDGHDSLLLISCQSLAFSLTTQSLEMGKEFKGESHHIPNV